MVEILSKCVCLTDLDENSLSNVSKDHEQSTEASNSSENFKIEISYLPRKIGYKVNLFMFDSIFSFFLFSRLIPKKLMSSYTVIEECVKTNTTTKRKM